MDDGLRGFDVTSHDGFELVVPVRRPFGPGLVMAAVVVVALAWLFVRVEVPRALPPADCAVLSQDADMHPTTVSRLGVAHGTECVLVNELPTADEVRNRYRQRRMHPTDAEVNYLGSSPWKTVRPLPEIADLRVFDAQELDRLDRVLGHMSLGVPAGEAAEADKATLRIAAGARGFYTNPSAADLDRLRQFWGLLTPEEADESARLVERVAQALPAYEARQKAQPAAAARALSTNRFLLALKLAMSLAVAALSWWYVRMPLVTRLRRRAGVLEVGDDRFTLADGWTALAEDIDLVLVRGDARVRIPIDPVCAQTPGELAEAINVGRPALERDEAAEAQMGRLLDRGRRSSQDQ